MSGLLKGTWPLTKLLFRKNRFKILAWIIGIVGVSLATAAAYPTIYQTEEDIKGFALTVENPAMISMIGPGYALEDYTTTAQTFAHEMLLFTAIAAAIMSILLVGRATRADEEDGQLELVLSLPVGRLSYLMAALIEVFTANLLIALLLGIGLNAVDVEGISVEACFLYGALIGSAGMVFGGLTAIFAQLMETSKSATGFSFASLIIAYILRAIGDVDFEALSFISPLGWTVRSYVFVENAWWPVLLSLGIGIVSFSLAFYLNRLRDLGAGFIQPKKGKTNASFFLKTPIGFIFRQQRTNIIAWAIGLFLLSAAFGAIMGDLETYYGDNELIQMMLQGDPDFSLTEQFVVLLIGIMSIFSMVPVLMMILRLLSEEKKNRTEHFYSRAVSRTKVLGNYFLASCLVAIFMQFMVALGLWSAAASVMEEALLAKDVFGASLLYSTAILVVITLAILLIGFLPKAASGLSWLYFAFCFVVIYMKDILDFPEWLSNVSVFEHVPKIPVEEFEIAPIISLVLVAVLLSIFGFIGYNKRDIQG